MKVGGKIVNAFLKVSLKWKVFAILAFILTIDMALIGPRTIRAFKEDKTAYIKELTGRLSRSTAKSFLNRINTLQDKLVIFTSYRESLAHTSVKLEEQASVLFSQEQEFLDINLIKVDEKNSETVGWSLRNSQNSVLKTWPSDFEKMVLPRLNFAKSESKGRGLWMIKGPQGEDLYVFGLRVEITAPQGSSAPLTSKTWITGILAANAFDDLFSDFATGVNKAYILDENGFALASSDSTARQQNLKSQSIFSDALLESKMGGVAEYKIDGRPLMASSEPIYKTNLVVVVTTPEQNAFEAAGAISRSVLIIGLTLMALGLGITVLFSNFFLTGPLKKMAAAVDDMGRGRFDTPIDILNRDELKSLSESLKNIEGGLSQRSEVRAEKEREALTEARMEAYRRVSRSVVGEIKNPMAGILGYIQLATAKASNEEVKNHLGLAEREVRRCKGIIESLGRLGGLEKTIPQMTNLAQAVQDVLISMEHRFKSHCKIYKDFRPCPLVLVDPELFKQVVTHLILNALEAMESTEDKNLTVRVMEVASHVEVHISDTGVGISDEIKSKIFEPFFSTKKTGRVSGIGLAISQSIIKEGQGRLSFRPGAGGRGTDFIIELPLSGKRVMAEKLIEAKQNSVSSGEEIPVPVPIPNVGIPRDLPPRGAPSDFPAPALSNPWRGEKSEGTLEIKEAMVDPTPTVRTVPDFKIDIRRPKLRL